MSFDKTTDEWHLTPNGWVAGSSYVYNVAQNHVAPPPDRVETWDRNMVQSSAFSSEDVSWNLKWKSPKHSQEERDRIRNIHKRPD